MSGNRKEQILASIQVLTQELQRMENRPPEPDEANVILFELRFTPRGTRYMYAGVRVGDHWYITGSSQAGRERTWEELMDFVEGKLIGKIMHATSWEEL